MASKGATMDPLRGGGAFDDQDMEDLTAHLASLPVAGSGPGGRRSSQDGLDLGDNTELLQGNMDRFRALAGDDPHDDLFTSFGGLGGRAGLGPLGHAADPADPAAAAANVIYTTNYPTYGELAAAKPPSYEDSVMYEQAPPSMHAAAAASGEAAALQGEPFSDPLGPLGDHAVAPAPPQPPAPAGYAAGRSPLSEPSPVNGGGGGAGGDYPPGPLGASPAFASGGGGGGGGARAAGSPGGGAGQGSPGRAGPPAPLLLPGGSMEFHGDEALSPSVASPGRTSQPGGPASASAAASRGAGLVISVGEPIKREQGGLFGIKGGYVTYLVRARCRQPGGGPGGLSRPETTVRRRFREFVALADLLKSRYRGYFVPPRPEKNAVEGQRMADGFVEERRLALERYLNKLAQHPVIGQSEELRLFLEADAELGECAAWLALRPPAPAGGLLDGTARFSKQLLGLDRGVLDPVQAAQPTKKAADFMRAIKETARSMQVPSSSLPPDEVALQRGREEVEAVQGALTGASRAAEKLVSRMDRWSVVSGELGMCLFQISRAEEEQGAHLAQHTGTLKHSGGLMHDTKRAGTALVRASRVGRKVTGRCAIELGCLHEYLGLMPAALKGLRARDKALLTADTLQADLGARRRAIAELEAAGARVLGGSEAKARKVADLHGDVAVLEQSVLAARAQYDKIKQTNQQELSRLRSELVSDMGSMLGAFARVMCANANRQLEIWLLAAHELGASPEQLQDAKAVLGAAAPAMHAAAPQSPLRQRGAATAAAGGGPAGGGAAHNGGAAAAAAGFGAGRVSGGQGSAPGSGSGGFPL